MISPFKSLLYALLLALYCQVGFASDSLMTISILTCSPGKEVYAMYGHNAIRINDKQRGLDITFNYGTFDFDTPGFVFKFMRGKLPYSISETPYQWFMEYYLRNGQNVTEQYLSLTHKQMVKIDSFIVWNMRPENKLYMYDFFMDNCATRLRDILELEGIGVLWENEEYNHTFRSIIKKYQKNKPWTDFGIDLIIGAPADQNANNRGAMFIPDVLADAIDRSTNSATGRQLLDSKIIHESYNREVEKKPFFLTPTRFFAFLLLLEVSLLMFSFKDKFLGCIKYWDLTWIVLCTITTLLIIFMWFFTDHVPTKYNWNLLWASPIYLYWWIFRNKDASKYLAAVASILLLVSTLNSALPQGILPQFMPISVAFISLILLLKIIRTQLNNKYLQKN